jgi:hypothetical protein
MIKKGLFPKAILVSVLILFLASCSSLTGKKKDAKSENLGAGKTVTIEGMENIKGVNPPKSDNPKTASSPKAPPPAAVPKKEQPQTASTPNRPFQGSTMSFLQLGFKRKVAILDFENKTNYKDEKVGEVVAKKLSDKLESTQRVLTVDKAVILEALRREGRPLDNFEDISAIKHVHRTLGVQAFALGAVTDVSLLSSKTSETSDEEVAFATAKVEIRFVDASTGNLLRTFVGRSPIFGTRETGEYSRGKAVLKAIDFGIEDIMEGLLRQLDILDWNTTIARIEGETLYINAGKLSGLRIGDTLEVFELGKEIIHSASKLSLGWTSGHLKGAIKVTELFGVDAAVAKVVQGNGFDPSDIVKSTLR